MRKIIAYFSLAGGLLWTHGWARGQSAPLAFDLATVKPWDPQAVRVARAPVSGGPGTSDPGQISYHNDLRRLFMQAYGVRSDQIAGPEWMKTERFDITAKVPRGASTDQVNVMLQNLLVERFGVALHHEMRDAPAYAMTVAKGGLKLAETAYPNAPADEPASLSFARDKNDFPIIPKELAVQIRVSWAKAGSIRSAFRAFTLARLAKEVEGALPDFLASEEGVAGVPPRVLDQTGVTGQYDFTLEYGNDSPDSTGPSIFSALEKQLGLHLDKIKIPQDVIVIERINKTPQDN